MKRGDKRIKRLPDGTELTLKYQGKGRFCTAWLDDDDPFNVQIYVYLLDQTTAHQDYSKEIMSREIGIGTNPYLPDVTDIGYTSDGDHGSYVYSMPMYYPLKAKYQQAWSDFKKVKKCFDEAELQRIANLHETPSVFAVDFNRMVLSEVGERFGKFHQMYNAIERLIDAGGNYGEYFIEIAKRNCGIDSDTHLVIYDPLYNRDTMTELYQRKEQRHRQAMR